MPRARGGAAPWVTGAVLAALTSLRALPRSQPGQQLCCCWRPPHKGYSSHPFVSSRPSSAHRSCFPRRARQPPAFVWTSQGTRLSGLERARLERATHRDSLAQVAMGKHILNTSGKFMSLWWHQTLCSGAGMQPSRAQLCKDWSSPSPQCGQRAWEILDLFGAVGPPHTNWVYNSFDRFAGLN